MIDVIGEAVESDVGPGRAYHQVGHFREISVHRIAHLIEARSVSDAMRHTTRFDVG